MDKALLPNSLGKPHNAHHALAFCEGVIIGHRVSARGEIEKEKYLFASSRHCTL